MKVVKINPHLIFVPELQMNDIIETDEHSAIVVVKTFRSNRLVTRSIATGTEIIVPCKATTRVRKLGYLVSQE